MLIEKVLSGRMHEVTTSSWLLCTVADPDLELAKGEGGGGGGEGVFFACPAGFSSFCDIVLPINRVPTTAIVMVYIESSVGDVV